MKNQCAGGVRIAGKTVMKIGMIREVRGPNTCRNKG